MQISRKALVGTGLAAALIGGSVAFTLLRRHPVGNPRVPEPRRPVDLQRYVGRWYEVARYEQRFERGCRASTADYRLRSDGKIDVINRCRKDNGRFEQARGIAKVVDPQTTAKLKVSFFGPFFGDYWVLDHADDYGWSIVGEPSGRCLWILTREPNPSEQQVSSLTHRVSAMGYDTSMLVFDEH